VKAFDLELGDDIAAAIAAHGERAYPDEACGLVLGSASELVRVEPMKNVQDRYNRLDPVRFRRTARAAFRFDELERMRALERAEQDGLVERIVYHSHPDAGAYFSPEDRAGVVIDGVELLPGVVHVVISIVGGKAGAMAAFRYDPSSARFDEAYLSPADTSWPDLEARAMGGREAERPIRPAGGRLVRRRVSADEAALLSRSVELRVDVDAATLLELRRLALGLYSPADGFPAVLTAGWPPPLDLPGSAGAAARVELVFAGIPVAVLRTTSSSPWAGAVAVYPAALRDGDRDAADVRAELLRRGAERATLATDTVGALVIEHGDDRIALNIPAPSDPALLDRFAQNLGATQVRDGFQLRAVTPT